MNSLSVPEISSADTAGTIEAEDRSKRDFAMWANPKQVLRQGHTDGHELFPPFLGLEEALSL